MIFKTPGNDYRAKYSWDMRDNLTDEEIGLTPMDVVRYLWDQPDTGAETSELEDIVCLSDWLNDLVPGIVERARASGHSWQDIGQALGMTKQAAQQRFGAAN